MARVTAEDRKKTGMKGGKYPVNTKAQARSAIRLRHHGKGVSAAAVLRHVSAVARRRGWQDILKAVATARERDKKRRK